MKTASFAIENLCVPCRCACRHCLLSAAPGRAWGVDYARGQAFAERFLDWAAKNRPDLSVLFYVGCCNDFPQLPDYLHFLHERCPLPVLQFNGLALRTEREADALLRAVKNGGVRGIDLTFYGVGDYHDRFAGRRGDYEYLLLLLRRALAAGLTVDADVMLIRENMAQMPALFAVLDACPLARCSVILPHAKGRGVALSGQRITKEDLNALCPEARARFSRLPHLTEGEWLARGRFPEAEARHLTLALTPENIGRLEAMDPADILRELEETDEAYYAALPPIGELAARYGRPENRQVFRYRDLVLQWQKRFLSENPLSVPDMSDERHSFSVRVYEERIL
ncbi:MAG: hypothetical protein ACI4PC_01585 [Oscillospiraceae bacterium]